MSAVLFLATRLNYVGPSASFYRAPKMLTLAVYLPQDAAHGREAMEGLVRSLRLIGPLTLVYQDAARVAGDKSFLQTLGAGSSLIEAGLPDVDAARSWLDMGARQVVLPSNVSDDVLQQLPQERVSIRLDVVGTSPAGSTEELAISQQIEKLKARAGGFQVHFLDAHGKRVQANLPLLEQLVKAAKPARVTVVAKLQSASDVVAIDRIGAGIRIDALPAAEDVTPIDAFCALIKSDRPDGLFSTLVVDENGVGLGICYSNAESIREAVKTKRGVYWSRTRGLWRKGETSGATQELLRVDLDCDRDTLRFTVRQQGAGFCHENTWTCFGEDWGIGKLARTLEARKASAPLGSYTKRLFEDAELLKSKLLEEAQELVDAKTKEETAAEAADVLYFTLVYCAKAGVTVADIERVLDSRSLKVTRRPGNAKPAKK